jgi:hypothetical protein
MRYGNVGSRLLAAGYVLLLLAGCAATDPLVTHPAATSVGSWRIERQVDRVTGAPISSALLPTRTSSHSGVAFPQPAMLQLTCFKEQPIVRLSFDFKIGSNKNSVLGYRFDDNPGREVEARFLQDHTTVVIEDTSEVEQFVKELATSKVLYVRIRSLNAGRTSAEFRLEGASSAIEAGFAGCRPQGEPKRPRPS